MNETPPPPPGWNRPRGVGGISSFDLEDLEAAFRHPADSWETRRMTTEMQIRDATDRAVWIMTRYHDSPQSPRDKVLMVASVQPIATWAMEAALLEIDV